MTHTQSIRIEFIMSPDAYPPYKKYEGDAGWDLAVRRNYELLKGHHLLSTGIYMSLPHGYWGHIMPRSSTLEKYGLEIIDAVIDNGFRGELYIQAVAHREIFIPKGTRLAQIIPRVIVPAFWTKVDKLPSSDRGENGFGSTGETLP